MAAKVVDASALAAVLFGEPAAEGVAARLSGHSLYAVPVLPFEIANTCLKKMRRSPLPREALLAMFARYDDAAIETLDIDPTEMLMTAEAHGLSSYDASYLCLARRLRAELVTLDKKLEAAANAVLS
ncbi:MAG TPA: type II toxin-antitoxin system VapC family toxin [Stellaceae bacterium]|jgi:predicted nucleic acid-binding protein|nr:type II toxin-antitoxin system VapC family toxin [Stellaceae bacterium]